MKIIVALFFSLIFLGSEGQTDNGEVAFRISEKDLIPEGITFSLTTNSFYVSSILKTKIIKVNAESGKFEDFITANQLKMRYLGMIVDEKRNHLWACGNLKKNGNYYSTVAKFNLTSGDLIKSYLHVDSSENIFNDLVQDKEGNVYFTNTSKQTIHKIDRQIDSSVIFFDSNEILHPNGITISPDEKYLYVASTEKGIRILNIASRTIMNLPDSTNNSKGLDGLKYFNNSIIGVQNEVSDRKERKISRYHLDTTGTVITFMEILDQNNPHFDIPTTIVIVENKLFCLANSQMGNVDWDNYTIRSYEHLDDNIILKYDLE